MRAPIIRTASRLSVAIAIALALGGCAVQEIHDTSKELDKVDHQSQAALIQPQRGVQSSVEVVHGLWVSGKAMEREPDIDPALRCKFSYAPHDPATLDQFADRVQSQCGVGVRISSDAQQALAGLLDPRPSITGQVQPQAQTVSSFGTSSLGLPSGFTPPPLAGANNSFTGYNPLQPGGATRTTRISISVQNIELHNALDAALGQLSLSYKYDPERKLITVYYLDTKTFPINTLPGENTVNSDVQAGATVLQGVSGGNSGGGGGGQASTGMGGTGVTSASTTSKLSNNVLQDLQAVLASMCSHPNCAIVTPSTSAVTVTDTPEVVDKIGRYMRETNRTLYRQVTIHLQILLYTNTKTSDAGVDLTATFKSAAGKFGATLVSPYTAATGAGTLTTNVIAGNGQWSGSQAVIDALWETGRVATVYDNTFTVTNLQPVPIQVFQNDPFVQQNTSSQTANVGSQQTLTTATVSTGFFMNLMPNILMNGREVLMQFSQNISVLDAIKQFGTDANFTQGAKTEGSALTQRAHVASGQTIVMTGFQANGLTLNGSAGIMGGGAGTNNKRQTIIVLATPVVDASTPDQD